MFHNRLREAREEYGMTVTLLAKRANVSKMTITDIELYGAIPKIDTALRISKVLKMDVNDIFWMED